MTRNAMVVVFAMQVAASHVVAQTPPPSPPPSSLAAPPAASPPAAEATTALVFGSDVGIVINPIRPEKTADFELVMNRLKEGLERSADPVRRQQGSGWKILKASEPGPAGTVLYLFLMDPVVTNADYTVSRILAEAFPTEIADLWPKLRDSYAGNMNRLSLQLVVPDMKATPGP